MDQDNAFKWRHYAPAIIRLCLRWSLRYSLRYRDLAEMMADRDLPVDHTTIYRWVPRYAPELPKCVRAQLQPTNDSWRVDETSSKVPGDWASLYRAVASAGNPRDFVLSPFRHAQAAEYGFRQLLSDTPTVAPRVITVDKNAADPPAFKAVQEAGPLTPECECRPVKYLNNLIERTTASASAGCGQD